MLIDCFEKKEKTITGYYASLLVRFNTAIAEKLLGMAKKKVLFHHDNAPVHSNLVTQQKWTKLRFKLLPHPAYSPDLALPDFHLFRKIKKFLAGQKFVCNEEAIPRRSRIISRVLKKPLQGKN